MVTAVSKSWVFTRNNYDQSDLDRLCLLGADQESVTYLVFGREVGESGTPHLQGCVTFRSAKRRTAVSRLIPGSFLDVVRGSLSQAREYCTKDDPEPFVFDHGKQGQRTDLEAAVSVLREEGVSAMLETYSSLYVKYHGGLEKLAARLQKPRDPNVPPEVTWIFGPTGSCKSRLVYETEPDLWISLATHKWWEGYEQQRAILIDDMRCNYAPFNDLLKILDRYPYTAEKKGSSVQLNSPRIYITSQFPPHLVYNRDTRKDEDIAQLYRRIFRVIRTHKVYTSFPQSCFLKYGILYENVDKEILLEEDRLSVSRNFVNPFEPARSWPQPRFP